MGVLVICCGVGALAACGDGDNATEPSVAEVQEGVGPSLDLSDGESAEAVVADAATAVMESYDETYDNEIAIDGDAAAETRRQEFCNTGSLTVTFEPDGKVVSVSGYSTLSAVEADGMREEDDITIALQTQTGTIAGKLSALSGSSRLTGTVTASQGRAAFCAKEGFSGNNTLAIEQQLSGTFSLSQGVGAAVSFALAFESEISGTTEEWTATGAISGNAVLKSGGKEIHCTIRGTTDTPAFLFTSGKALIVVCL